MNRPNRLLIVFLSVMISATACSPNIDSGNLLATRTGPTIVSSATVLAPTELPTQPLPTVSPTQGLVIAGIAAVPTNTPKRPTLTPTTNPAPVFRDGGPSGTLTLDNNNQLMTLHPGETFLLKLGEIYEWTVEIDHPEFISREVNVAVVKGAQGIYQAHQKGTATMTATGDPLCRQSKPACMLPSRIFTLHIEVLP